jgi:hypothetical protein
MALDLYSYYKKYYQRWHRNQFNDDFFELKEISYQIAYIAYRNKFSKNEKSLLKIKKLVQELSEIEEKYCGMQMFHKDIERALKKNDYEVNVPYSKIHKWNFDSDLSAYVYIAISNLRPGECKLGVTTLEPSVRAKKYLHKYGYSIKIYKSLIAKNPYSIENKAQNDLEHLRVSKNIENDSIEWYRMDPEEMYRFILGNIER